MVIQFLVEPLTCPRGNLECSPVADELDHVACAIQDGAAVSTVLEVRGHVWHGARDPLRRQDSLKSDATLLRIRFRQSFWPRTSLRSQALWPPHRQTGSIAGSEESNVLPYETQQLQKGDNPSVLQKNRSRLTAEYPECSAEFGIDRSSRKDRGSCRRRRPMRSYADAPGRQSCPGACPLAR